MFLSWKILLKLQEVEEMPVCLKEMLKCSHVQSMETLNPTLSGTKAVNWVETQFPLKNNWRQEKLGATLVLQVILLVPLSVLRSA